MKIRLGTRGSRLALWQARRVTELILAQSPSSKVELVEIRTSGDARSEFGDDLPDSVGEFSSELERALIEGEVDVAVHSAKDLPTKIPEKLTVGAYPERADPRDAWVRRKGAGSEIGEGGIMGTGSPRRTMLWKERWPKSVARAIRGNVDRRMERILEEKEWSGILLACAGIDRLGGVAEGLEMERLSVEWMVPAPGQGALAVECRKEDTAVLAVLNKIDDPIVRSCVSAEKSFLAKWGGGCSESLGAFALILANGTVHLQAAVENRWGGVARAQMEGPRAEAELVGVRLAEEMSRG